MQSNLAPIKPCLLSVRMWLDLSRRSQRILRPDGCNTSLKFTDFHWHDLFRRTWPCSLLKITVCHHVLLRIQSKYVVSWASPLLVSYVDLNGYNTLKKTFKMYMFKCIWPAQNTTSKYINHIIGTHTHIHIKHTQETPTVGNYYQTNRHSLAAMWYNTSHFGRKPLEVFYSKYQVGWVTVAPAVFANGQKASFLAFYITHTYIDTDYIHLCYTLWSGSCPGLAEPWLTVSL